MCMRVHMCERPRARANVCLCEGHNNGGFLFTKCDSIKADADEASEAATQLRVLPSDLMVLFGCLFVSRFKSHRQAKCI